MWDGGGEISGWEGSMYHWHFFIYPFVPLFNNLVLRDRYQHIAMFLGVNPVRAWQEKEKTRKKKKKKVRKLCIQLTNKGKQPDYYSRSNWGKQSFNTADLWCPEMITLYFLYVFTPRGPRLDLCKNVNLAKASLQCIIILPSHQLHKLLQTLNWGTWGLPIRGTYSEHQQSKRPKERKVKNLISDIFF